MPELAELTLRIESIEAERAGERLKKLESAGRRAEKSSQALERSYTHLTRALKWTTVAVVGLLSVSTKLATDFDTEMRKITAQVGIAREQVNLWRGDMLRMVRDVGRAPKELAEGLFFVTSAGQKGALALDTLRKSAMGAAAGFGDTKVLADVATSAIDNYGAAALNAGGALGTLAATVKLGKAEADTLAPAFARIIPFAAQLGVEFHEIGAALAVMTRKGTDASTAGSAIRGMLSKIIKPTVQGKQVMEELGLSMDRVRQVLRDDGLLATLQLLDSTFGDNQEAMGRVFEDVQALSAVLQILSGDAESTKAIFTEMANVTEDELSKAFNEMSDGPGFKFNKALNLLKAIGIEIGDKVLPDVVDVIDAFNDALEDSEGFVSAVGDQLKTVAQILRDIQELNPEYLFRTLAQITVAGDLFGAGLIEGPGVTESRRRLDDVERDRKKRFDKIRADARAVAKEMADLTADMPDIEKAFGIEGFLSIAKELGPVSDRLRGVDAGLLFGDPVAAEQALKAATDALIRAQAARKSLTAPATPTDEPEDVAGIGLSEEVIRAQEDYFSVIEARWMESFKERERINDETKRAIEDAELEQTLIGSSSAAAREAQVRAHYSRLVDAARRVGADIVAIQAAMNTELDVLYAQNLEAAFAPLRQLEQQLDTVSIVNDAEQRRAQETAAYARQLDDLNIELETRNELMAEYARSLREIDQLEARRALGKVTDDLGFQASLVGMSDRARERAEFLRQNRDNIREAAGGDPAEIDRISGQIDAQLKGLQNAQEFQNFRNSLSQMTSDGFEEGLWDAINQRDWKDSLRAAFEDISRSAFSFAFKSLTATQGGDSNIFSDIFGSLSSAAGAGAGGAGDGAEAAATVAAKRAASEGQFTVNVFNVPDEATAGALVNKAPSQAAVALVARGSGQPGVTTGSVRPGRRGR